MESGMCILANNFICNLNCFFSDTFTPSELTFSTNDIVTQENSVSDESLDLQIMSKNRLKYPTNPLIAYFTSTNSKTKSLMLEKLLENFH